VEGVDRMVLERSQGRPRKESGCREAFCGKTGREPPRAEDRAPAARLWSKWTCLAALTLATSGCQGLERVDECRAVTRLANPVLVEIDRQHLDVHAATYRTISAEYEALASSAAQVKIRTKRVAEAVNDYERMLHEAARDARVFADALDAKDEARIAVARTGAARTLRHEATAIARLDIACRFR
jgi:hypothetical protein